MAMRKTIEWGIFAVLWLTTVHMLIGCQGSELAKIDGDVNVLENPLPLNLSSPKTYTNPPTTLPANKVIAVLTKGQMVPVMGRVYGKDFLAYEIQLPDRSKGYLFHGDAFHLVSSRGAP
jgi:hypothetical protein